MQNAKDTFYEVMRSRIASANPERTIVVRGLIRPGVLVEENELASAVSIADCFRLQWAEASVDTMGAMPVLTLRCEVLYETAGSAMNGMDRGRALTAMDAELSAAVNASPQNARKRSYAAVANGGAAVPLSTNIWWSAVELGPARIKGDRLVRTTSVAVMSFEEAGEQ